MSKRATSLTARPSVWSNTLRRKKRIWKERPWERASAFARLPWFSVFIFIVALEHFSHALELADGKVSVHSSAVFPLNVQVSGCDVALVVGIIGRQITCSESVRGHQRHQPPLTTPRVPRLGLIAGVCRAAGFRRSRTPKISQTASRRRTLPVLTCRFSSRAMHASLLLASFCCFCRNPVVQGCQRHAVAIGTGVLSLRSGRLLSYRPRNGLRIS